MMRRTYADAAAVLVIDPGIEPLLLSTSTKERRSLGILTSGWTQRLWTLQEAVVAVNLIFKFSCYSSFRTARGFGRRVHC